jgi:hypothetical protein
MSKIDTALSNTFQISPIAENKNQLVSYEEREIDSSNIDDDIDAVRSNLYSLLEKGETALEDLTEIAKAEESPRAFEVLNSMLNTMSDISMKLLEIEERKIKMKKMRTDSSQQSDATNPTTVNNNVVFVGTTQELQNQIKSRLSGN